MSAKWRALQHRHRYTYNAINFPQSYLNSLTLLPSSNKISHNFCIELTKLTSLNSIYAQVNHIKNVTTSFNDLLLGVSDETLVCIASKLYLELLFLENSYPLHKGLLSVLSKNRKFCSLIGGCFRELCDEYGGALCGKGKGRGRGRGRRFCVSRVALSMMSTPKLGYLVDVVEECCLLVAMDVVEGLEYVVVEANGRGRPSPIVMEQCQEGLSCLYYLLQRFPLKFSDEGKSRGNGVVGEGLSVSGMVVRVILCVLKSCAFSRDCFVAAGVSFCAALQVLLSPEELGFLILEGVFERKVCGLVGCLDSEFKNGVSKVPYDGDLCCEIRNFSQLSRLCFIRGVLTAVSRTVQNLRYSVEEEGLNDGADEDAKRCLHSVLYDCILPELCKYCENPNDSHFNFHALTVLQICLQQIKTSVLGNLVDFTTELEPIPDYMGARVLRIIWNNLEDPLSQTVKQVHLIFDHFLDIKATVYREDDHVKLDTFLAKITADLLCLGARCKGRYVPLASLTKRLGAKTLLGKSPNLLFEVVHAYIDDDVCSAATSFLKCFLECLRDECWSSDGVERGYDIYRGHCLLPFIYGLASGVSKLRSNLNTYALPSLLEVDVDSIFFMLSFLSISVGLESSWPSPDIRCLDIEFGIEQKVAILVSLLKVSRSLALFVGDIESIPTEGCTMEEEHAFIHMKGFEVKIPVAWLALALTHVDESIRVDAAESLFLNPKTASLPSILELNLMRLSVPLNMRCCSTAFQMKWASLFKKFFSRVRTALERQIKLGNWQPSDWGRNDIASLYKTGDQIMVSRAENLYQFMKWLSCYLFFSCYPSAPYERKIMAMELIMIMMNVWSIIPPEKRTCESLCAEDMYIFSEGLIRPDSTMLLVSSIVDSWDRLRESSFRILLSYPRPLPGISSENKVQEVISWAKRLVCKTRVRESDAGALVLRLIFRKYVLGLNWIVGASVNVICHKSGSGFQPRDIQMLNSTCPVVLYLNSLIHWLQAVVEEGEKDLLEACKNSFVHGVLLALRYTFEELDWNSDVDASSISEMRSALGNLLELVRRITSLALWVVSADAWHLPQDMDDVDEDSFLLETPDELVSPSSNLESEVKDVKDKEDARPTEQIVMVGCWLAMKEVSLLLGTIIRKIPLPVALTSIGEGTGDAAVDPPMSVTDAVLDVNQLEVIGNHFLEVLLKMKHNGAIDKTRAGFTALCNRLLCSDDPRLCQLTESWMEQLMERTVAKGQTVDDLLRRSAGIPAAFSAFFLSEPQGAPKKLLPRALCWLIEVAGGSLVGQVEPDIVDKLQSGTNAISDVEDDSLETNEIIKSAKTRVEGVIPTVHAFNVLRAAFNDANLASDTSGFSAEAMIISIRSFSSPHWEIRNSACLAYTALVRRMVGFLNVHKRESARRAITSLEFFHRYPALHPFVFNELKVATEYIQGAQANSTLASIVHPSLCPVLILLSRLKPSPIASEEGDILDPFLFMPFIQRCSTQRNMRIRILASRALTGLVSNEKLHSILLDIASQLSYSGNKTESTFGAKSHSFVSFNSIHGILLQLSALLDVNCRNLAEFSLKDLILKDLIETLSKCSWIGSSRSCPCPILNASFLKVLDSMLSIAGTRHASKNYDAICSLLSGLCSECLDLESESSFPDPTVVELRKQATISYFRCVYLYEECGEEVCLVPSKSSPTNRLKVKPSIDSGFDDVERRLTCYISDTSYEVRLATFKWLFRVVKFALIEVDNEQNGCVVSAIAHWAKSNLQTTLLRLLSGETNHKCAYYILRIIFAWNLLQYNGSNDRFSGNIRHIGEMDLDSVLLFWDKLISMHDSAKHTKIQEILLCCFGLCVKRFAHFLRNMLANPSIENPEDLKRCSLLCEKLIHFVSLIKQYCDASQQVNLRKAVGESVVACGLLEQTTFVSSLVINNTIVSDSFKYSEPLGAQDLANMFAYMILEVWFTCIKLLEDEDVSIRKGLSLEVQKYFPPKFQGCSLAGGVPAQVEKVIELSFGFLLSVYGHWGCYVDYLLKWVFDALSFTVPEGDLVQRVFDKEIDNHHEEKLLICQICLSNLENLELSKTRGPGFFSFARTWRGQFLCQLLSFSGNYIEKLGGAEWVGGVGNHKDAFLPLYGNLLAFYTLSSCIAHGGSEDGIGLLSDVVEIEKSIRPFLQNPLVCNLYILVVRLHEKMAGASANHLIPQLMNDVQIWNNFNPYFLLK